MSKPSYEESSRLRGRIRIERRVFDVPAARLTLPLLARVVADVVGAHACLSHLRLRHARLALADPSRKRELFSLADTIETQQGQLAGFRKELEAIGAVLLDPVHGEVGFPTIVNGSLAYLIYRLDDEEIHFWRYRDQPKLRPIPSSWYDDTATRSQEREGLLV